MTAVFGFLIMAKKKQENQVNVCWISGNYFERRAFIDKLKAYLDGQGGYELSVYTDEETIEYCQNQILQSSCFSENRLFIFNDWPKTNKTKQTFYKNFIELCEKSPDDAIIVCNNLKTESKKVINAFKKMGKFCEFDELVKSKQAPKWFVGECEQKGKSIELKDAEQVIKAIGEKQGKYSVEIDRMHSMAEKLCNYVGNRKNITSEDVLTVCTDEPEFIIWNMYDYIDAKDFCGCMNMLAQAQSVSKSVDGFVNQIVSSIIWRYRLILFLKEGIAQKWDTERISREISKLHKLKRKEKSSGFLLQYSVDKYENGNEKSLYSSQMVNNTISGRYKKPPVLCYSRKEAFLILLAAEETQSKLRSGVTDAEALVLLDALMMTACSLVDNDLLNRIRQVNEAKIC